MDFFEYAHHHTWCRIQRSPIHGVGVFAIKDIPAYTNLFPDCTDQFHIHSVSTLRFLSPPVQKMCLDYFYHSDNKIFLPEKTLNQINSSFLLNYSKTPNCLHYEDGSIYSIRKIMNGEELTHSYE